ncbi:MAG: type II secretion system F family protein [Candidatus Dormibacteria bacterium]
MRSSPVLVFSLYLAFLALAAALAAAVGGGDVLLHPRLASRFRPIAERERDLAASLGWRFRSWLAVRILAIVAALIAAMPTGIPLLIVAAPIAMVFVVPYLFSGRAASRRLRRERTLVDWVRTMISRMRRNQGIDVVLRDSGLNPPYGLEWVLQPLGDPALLIDEALVQMANRARVPEAEMLCIALLASRTRRQEDLVIMLERVVLPVMEAKLTEQVDALEAMTQKRSQAVAMSLIMLGMFLALIRVDAIRHGFASFAGQVLLAVAAMAFALVLGLVASLYRLRTFTRWDLEAYRNELRGLGSV